MKIAIFIDGGYLDKIAEKEFNVRIDYEKISKELSLNENSPPQRRRGIFR